MFSVQPVIAACESLAIFAASSFVVWIVNQINAAQGKKAGGARPRQPARRKRPSHVQREIDRFIREATGKNQQGDVVGVDEIEIVDEPQRRRPPSRSAPEPLSKAAAAVPPSRLPRIVKPTVSSEASVVWPPRSSTLAFENSCRAPLSTW